MTYRIVKITSFYTPFLKYFYEKYPHVASLSYKEHYDSLMYEGHGWADFFQRHFASIGVEAFEIVHNAALLQASWAKENYIKLGNDILFEQIKSIKPDVVFFQDSISFSAEYIDKVRKSSPGIKLMLGHCCSPFSRQNLEAFSKLDFMLACSPGFVEIFNKYKIENHIFLHAFEAEILNRISIPNERKNEVFFSGSFVKVSDSNFHDDRLELVEHIIQNKIPFSLYGTIEFDSTFSILAKQGGYVFAQFLKSIGLKPSNSRIDVLRKLALLDIIPKKSNYSSEFLKIVKSPFYGLDMFQATANSAIAFNKHGGVAGDYAANMRMFEVAGLGTLLLTDHKKNINTIFEPDSEIVTYTSPDDCISKMKWLIENPGETKKIADAGQKRVLKDHSIQRRVEFLNEIISEHLRS